MSDVVTAPFDGQAAQIVPQNIEKIPLYHWRPGSRLLCVGSRDGAAFLPNLDRDEARTYHRTLSPELIALSHEKMHTDALCATYSASLYYPRSLEILLAVQSQGFCLVSAGFGDASVLDQIASSIAAQLVLIGPQQGPLLSTLLALDAHTEILLGVDGDDCCDPHIDWQGIHAVHLCALRPHAQPIELRARWYAQARAFVPQHIPVYDEDHQHSLCVCGETLVWRSGGRSRLDALDIEQGCCSSCGANADFHT